MSIESNGTVNFIPQSYKSNGHVTVIVCKYKFFADDYMLLIENCAPWGKDLIKDSENLNKFKGATVISGNGEAYVDPGQRSSTNLELNKQSSPELSNYVDYVKETVHMGAKLYGTRNKYLHIIKDTGFDMLRYTVGQRFGEHVDVIQGHPQWGIRRLSAVLYLNDDYEGGEIDFQRQKIKIKPRAGSLILFPSDFTYPHSSLEITKGIKYAVVTWFV